MTEEAGADSIDSTALQRRIHRTRIVSRPEYRSHTRARLSPLWPATRLPRIGLQSRVRLERCVVEDLGFARIRACGYDPRRRTTEESRRRWRGRVRGCDRLLQIFRFVVDCKSEFSIVKSHPIARDPSPLSLGCSRTFPRSPFELPRWLRSSLPSRSRAILPLRSEIRPCAVLPAEAWWVGADLQFSWRYGIFFCL